MLDIVAALEWVRDNIAAFGGDPGNVTIFGESGGGAKVSVLLAMPAAKGLFHKAVIQSGPAVQMATREDGTKTALQVLAELGLGDKDGRKLRSMPAEKILAAQGVVQARAASGPMCRAAAARLQSGDRRHAIFPAARSIRPRLRSRRTCR